MVFEAAMLSGIGRVWCEWDGEELRMVDRPSMLAERRLLGKSVEDGSRDVMTMPWRGEVYSVMNFMSNILHSYFPYRARSVSPHSYRTSLYLFLPASSSFRAPTSSPFPPHTRTTLPPSLST